MFNKAGMCRYAAYGIVAIISWIGIGCGAKQPPATLGQARAAYTQAAQDPQVTAQAPASLREAQEALHRAERVWEDDRDEQEVTHLAYLAEQRVGIAQAKAEHKLIEDERQRLNQEREAILREARLSEAREAQRQAELARQQAEQAHQARQAAAAEITLLQQQLGAMQAQETERGTVLTLNSVLFETNKATLKPGARQNLYPLVDFLRDHAARQVVIEGHTDSTGPEAYNLDLSQHRAEAVRDFLIQNNIAPTRITARGHGEAYPVASNETEAGRQQNRRVDIIFPN
jgi:outer membrane protein OmpA-like peptidoglycan-associated protein